MRQKHESGGVEAFRRWTFAHRKGLVVGAAGVLAATAAWKLLRGENPREHFSKDEAAALGATGMDLGRGWAWKSVNPQAPRERAMVNAHFSPEKVQGMTALVSADAHQFGDELTRVGAQRAAAYRNGDGEWISGLVSDEAAHVGEQSGVRRVHVAIHLGGPATEVALGLSNRTETEQDKPVFTPISTHLIGVGYVEDSNIVTPTTPSGMVD